MKIVVKRRSGDYIAFLEGRPEIWGCGENIYEAIGNLVNTHQDRFNIEIVQK